MKIIYITEYIDIAGGIERGLCLRANYLVENFDYRVKIYCTNHKSGRPYYPLNSKIQVIYLEKIETRKSFLGRLQLQYLQAKEIISENADVIISLKYTLHNLFFQYLKKNQKLISELRESKALHYINNKTLKSKLYNFVRKIVYSNQDLVITLTKEDKFKWGLKNMEFVHNSKMIYTNNFSLLEKERVLCVSRLDKIKGIRYLIEAWDIVHEIYPNWELKICGEGNDFDNLKKQIVGLELDKVVYLENKSVDVVPEYLKSSIFVLTSEYEAFGNVIVEAQTFGLPVISFDAPSGPREIINDGVDGFLVNLYDVEELATKIILLIKNFDLRKQMGAQAVENSKRFDMDVVMQKYIKLITA
ncbi:glycosyltransferase family 4 protein [Aequorivita echinoideorum]|uniref:Glycosyltransferase family 4 protein n=1 Tax=Aequorivita echinoideorum TaxID=1549647 RepID=A0ABS5S410_9FLAO|nr:glycosyltransferase family 4 protein [Aequorivita echinoideorum]MBT0607933.1 glycosyltransferase family 4 protein [Aequorivita echinoideorum]